MIDTREKLKEIQNTGSSLCPKNQHSKYFFLRFLREKGGQKIAKHSKQHYKRVVLVFQKSGGQTVAKLLATSSSSILPVLESNFFGGGQKNLDLDRNI